MSTEENELPKAVIARLLKNALPTGTTFRKLVSEKKEKNKKDESKPKEEDKAKMEEEEEDIQIVESVLSPKVLDDMPNEEEF
ncbi:hypothetical protein G6F46_012276 [Rhizopus delemar]|uniref:Uncharacterized protein n=2 Tax=Rhizopus TaxID=4842 RepID=A0A9P7CHW4_9FUNG|nr:hypothetical protein G6F43_011636 [Rhizopus delemar]KAG1533910.1 hypothetical protein G6F51_012378 [Rhizopus arrhizus]KAG1445248.1 hypothetical protein G6F55_012031 [Rhizopus delemar]KAG1489023.1 hypothetical protein G6F54_011736 [Rhizopus delemar]KAG1496280.1 hypothetical protein G6F53_012204 [Rhizopus delemar]